LPLKGDIHTCADIACPVCSIFGRPAEEKVEAPATRLIIRDAELTEESVARLNELELDLNFTEVKWENVINRITSAANPRQMERVPAGSEFGFEMLYSVYDLKDQSDDVDRLKHLFEAMKLVEDDYLGGQGSRGYGKVEFKDVSIEARPRDYYEGKVDPASIILRHKAEKGTEIDNMLASFSEIASQIRSVLKGKG